MKKINCLVYLWLHDVKKKLGLDKNYTESKDKFSFKSKCMKYNS